VKNAFHHIKKGGHPTRLDVGNRENFRNIIGSVSCSYEKTYPILQKNSIEGRFFTEVFQKEEAFFCLEALRRADLLDMKPMTITSIRPCFLLLALLPFAGLCAAETDAPVPFTGPQGYYRLSLAEGWVAAKENDFIKLSHKDAGTTIRIYELALRPKGGLYRDKRHALDDLKFQVVHEFKGEGKPYQSLKWEAGGHTFHARSFEGTFPKGEKRVHVYGVIIPAKDPEVVISFHCIGSEQSYQTHLKEIHQMLHSLEILK